MILNKSSYDTTNSNVDQNVKLKQNIEKDKSEVQFSQNFSNIGQNKTENQILESNPQANYNSYRNIVLPSKNKILSQTSIQNPNENLSMRGKQQDVSSSQKRKAKNFSMQTIHMNNRNQLEASRNGILIQSKQQIQYNNGSYRQNPAQASINIDLKLLQRIKKQVMYFRSLFTDSGRRAFFESKSIRKKIKDKSDIFEDKSNKLIYFVYKINEYLTVMHYLMKILSHVPLINPDSVTHFLVTFLICFYNCMFYILYTLFNIFKAPYEICSIYENISAFFWVLEILIKLNTSFYINKLTVTNNRKQILMRYFKKRFLFDIIPILFMTVIVPSKKDDHYVLLRLLVLIKFKNIFEDIDSIQKYFVMTFQNYYIIQLANLIVKLFIIGHTIACFYFIIGALELEYLGEPATWFGESIDDFVWWKIYQQAIFWALTLMTTGSNEAATVLQQFYVTFIMLLIYIIFAYILNVIGIILEELDTKDQNKRKDLNIINEYMRQKKISKYLQKKVNNDIEYFYENNQKKFEEDTEQILCRISKELNDQLSQEYCQQILSQISILKNNFSQEALNELHSSFEEAFYFPNQIVHSQKKDETSDNSLIFIVQGKLEITKSFDQLQDEKQTKIFSCKKNSVVGIYHFFTGLSRDYNIKSQDFTKIIKIKREDFVNSLKKYDKDYQIFCQIKDRLINEGNLIDINQNCQYCSLKSHLESQCPFVFFNKQHYSIKSIFTKSIFQERRRVNRKLLAINSFAHNNQIRDTIMDYIQEYLKDQEDQQEIDQLYSQNFTIESSMNAVQNENQQNSIRVEIQDDEDQNKNHSLISEQHSDEEQKQKKFQKEQKKKIKNSIFFKRETTKLDEKNTSPQVMHMNGRQKYFEEAFSLSLNPVNMSFGSDKAIGEQQRGLNQQHHQSTPKIQINQHSQLIYDEEDNSSLFQIDKKYEIKKGRKTEIKNDVKEQDYKFQLTGKIINYKTTKAFEVFEENIEWQMDKQKDYRYYYSCGNLRQILNKHSKFVKLKIKKLLKKSKKK